MLNQIRLPSPVVYDAIRTNSCIQCIRFGPHTAMQLAERLYTQGFISYPRTESTAYPASFDFQGTLKSLINYPSWGVHVRALLVDGFHKPRMGTDVGDHPPITPMKSATEDMLGNDAWRLYQTKVELSSGGELFFCIGQHVTVKGFTSIMPWLAVNEKNIPPFMIGERIKILKVDLYEGSTTPPDYLSESELISLMEKHGIGTDASIPVHINNICERNYVQKYTMCTIPRLSQGSGRDPGNGPDTGA
ncbi:hypothetical protein QJS10_CPB04g01426 [Acorus calamus]|uniref:DNA topoisomerase n=1 Tax=Acorus calamus TaxID=4465 RepID=A0AAV9F011_ACOCL|nr:hypothetical protein QJS10_CPB04g01426 [Acorus calamus]